MGKAVAIFGAGVSGLSAAHELVERGFQVTVYEKKPIPGGKSRSVPLAGSGVDGRGDLPGEHGFRYFPGFYKHVTDTMKRIPFFKYGSRCVHDNLVSTRFSGVYTLNEGTGSFPNQLSTLEDGLHLVRNLILSSFAQPLFNIPQDDFRYWLWKHFIFLSSCEQRRLTEYENLSWWEFMGAEKRSVNYQKYFIDGATRLMVATYPRDVSARTTGVISCQLNFLDIFRGDRSISRLLNGPTNEMWIDPWMSYLKTRGVEFRLETEVKKIHCSKTEITGVTVTADGQGREVKADWYILALPVEVVAPLLDDAILNLDPLLASLRKLRTSWMVGIQLYLDRPFRMNEGHTVFLDSPWALTAIVQDPYWPNFAFEEHGDGKVRGVISIDISDWDTPGVIYSKPARECSGTEIKNEVFFQMKMHLPLHLRRELDQVVILNWCIDPDLEFQSGKIVRNDAPLFINTKGSWNDRPEAATAIPNLFLAGDYVRTHTDLASMEAANEGARRAVNGLLSRANGASTLCELHPLTEPGFFETWKKMDEIRLSSGQPHFLSQGEKMGSSVKSFFKSELSNVKKLLNFRNPNIPGGFL